MISTDGQLCASPAMLIRGKIAKDDACTQHKFPVNAMNALRNCAVDGYLMTKAIDLSTSSALTLTPARRRGGAADKDTTHMRHYRDLRHESPANKEKLLKALNIDRKCVMAEGHSIEWDSFRDELIRDTDYVIDNPAHTAFICLRAVMEKPDAETHLPWNGTSYLYVVLVCSEVKGNGRWLMDTIEGMAHHLQLPMVLLSAMPNVLNFYLHFGYQFVDRNMRVHPTITCVGNLSGDADKEQMGQSAVALTAPERHKRKSRKTKSRRVTTTRHDKKAHERTGGGEKRAHKKKAHKKKAHTKRVHEKKVHEQKRSHHHDTRHRTRSGGGERVWHGRIRSHTHQGEEGERDWYGRTRSHTHQVNVVEAPNN